MDEPSEPLDGLGIDASMGEPPNDEVSGHYGTEYVLMGRYALTGSDENWAGLGLDLGFFVPGEALDDILNVGAVMKMLWRLDVGW